MRFKLCDQLSLPGDPAKPNEDSFGHKDHAVLVMDGATPLGEALMPGPSDAAWLAQFGARRLMAHLACGGDGRQALGATLAEAQHAFEALRRHPPHAIWQMPCASMMLAVERLGPAGQPQNPQAADVEMLWFGDCAALIYQEEDVIVVGDTLAKRAQEARRAAQMARDKKLSPASALRRPEFLEGLRAARAHINSGGNWLFSPDRRACAHVAATLLKLARGSTVLLATDGFFALASDYAAYDARGLMAAAMDKGLAALGEQLRRIEDSDAGGDRFPRFKKSDDATAILLRLI